MQHPPPRVTRLDQPSTIVTDGESITIQPQQPQDARERETQPLLMPNRHNEEHEQQQQHAEGFRSGGVPASWTEKGAFVEHFLKQSEKPSSEDHQHHEDNGSTSESSTQAHPHHSSYYWSQDRYAVHVRVFLPDNDDDNHNENDSVINKTKGSWTCTVEHILPYRDRHCAVLVGGSAAPPQRLVVRRQPPSVSGAGKQALPLLQGDLSHPVHLAEEDETVDWSIERCSGSSADGNGSDGDDRRYMRITLYKATPLPGMAIWWKKLLRQERDEIDLDWRNSNNAADGSSSNNQAAFQQAWDEAHAKFRSTVGEGPRHAV